MEIVIPLLLILALVLAVLAGCTIGHPRLNLLALAFAAFVGAELYRVVT